MQGREARAGVRERATVFYSKHFYTIFFSTIQTLDKPTTQMTLKTCS